MKQTMIKARAFATSFVFPYHILLFVFSIYAGIELVPESAWDTNEGAGRDFWPVFLVFYWVIAGLAGSGWAFVQSEEGEKLYEKKLKKSKYSIPKRQIIADLNDRTGEILVYEETKSILGNEKKLLNTFDSDSEDIHTYVAEQRERVAEPDLNKAKAIVNSINGN